MSITLDYMKNDISSMEVIKKGIKGEKRAC